VKEEDGNEIYSEKEKQVSQERNDLQRDPEIPRMRVFKTF
jgi:hypothetical protein